MGTLRISRMRIIASTLMKFHLELERDMREELSDVDASLAWRTRPTLERAWFEIVARAEGGEQLKPLILKKLRPFVRADSCVWSNLWGTPPWQGSHPAMFLLRP
ncbi:hypothetical protein AMTR_s00052p00153660 [Amborella trichopoda]|uniref:Uncharacterized protein n=1 Tax=Amborella trichopoda TaxID=13333 RepID=U5D4R6_AMBTC|nr:hypothetical protein AMTR_s00052p00153660 [Amborella trichopoda]